MYEMFQNIHIFHWLNRRGQPLAMCFEHMNFTEMLFGISSSALHSNTTKQLYKIYINIYFDMTPWPASVPFKSEHIKKENTRKQIII